MDYSDTLAAGADRANTAKASIGPTQTCEPVMPKHSAAGIVGNEPMYGYDEKDLATR